MSDSYSTLRYDRKGLTKDTVEGIDLQAWKCGPSACVPVMAVCLSAVARADAQLVRAVWSAPQLLTRVSHMNAE